METINSDFTSAMKAKEEAKLSTLRLLKAALKNKQIELRSAKGGSASGGHELSEDEALAVVKSQMKQNKDALDSFVSAGRDDLAAQARQELAVLEAYLPAQMDEAALMAVVKEAVEKSGATGKADMGKAMGAAMKAVAGRSDGTRVKAIVESLLAAFILAVAVSVSDAPVVHAAARAAVTASGTEAFVEPALRIARIFLMALGIISVNFILIGGFTYMTASGREEGHHHGEAKFFSGLLGTVVIAGLFAVVTVALQKM